MRILHVTEPVDGGVARVVENFAKLQVEKEHDVYVACPKDGWLPEQLRNVPAVRLIQWEARRGAGTSTLSEILSLATIVRRIVPDVLHLHSSKAGLAGRLVPNQNSRVVFQPHAWSFEARDSWLSRVSASWERFAIRRASTLVCVSTDELETGRRAGVDVSKGVIVPNGFDETQFFPSDRIAAKEALQLEASLVILCVGRLSHQKGQDRLLQLAPRLLSAFADATIVFVGDGPLAGQLQESSRGPLERRIKWVGAQSAKLQTYYAASDLVVLPSRWEAMAVVPLEAMACGRTVIGFDVPGLQSTLGEAGVIIEQGDVDGLESGISALLRDSGLRRDMETRGVLHVNKLFTRQISCNLVLQSYRLSPN